jgi:phage FluMu protein gp41
VCVSKLTTIITTVLHMNMEGLDKLSHDALFQSQQLIESMDDEFLFKSEVNLTQNILRRNQELIGMIDAFNESKDLSKDDLAKKNVYALELHSNMQGMSRLLKEMAAASRQKK